MKSYFRYNYLTKACSDYLILKHKGDKTGICCFKFTLSKCIFIRIKTFISGLWPDILIMESLFKPLPVSPTSLDAIFYTTYF